MQRFIFTLLGLLLLSPFSALAAGSMPAGVLSDVLWFSKDPFFAGDTITVYTVVYNSTDYRLSGTIELRNGTTTIGTKEFIAPPSGGATIIPFPWSVKEGTHSFAAVIIDSEFRSSDMRGEVIANTTITGTKTANIKRFADLDTDHDGTGNLLDGDDDNDGLSDPQEKQAKTNSLEPDTDGDGLLDGKDPHPLIKEAPLAASSTLALSLSSSTSQIASNIEEKVKAVIPEPIVSTALPIIGDLEDLRVTQAVRANEEVENIQLKLETARKAREGSSESASSSARALTQSGWQTLGSGVVRGEVIKTPFEYVILFFVLLWQLVAGTPWLFYSFLLLVIFYAVRFIFRIFA